MLFQDHKPACGIFTNVDVLGGLDAELLIQLFRKFPKFFEEHEIHLENGTLNFEDITKALKFTDGHTVRVTCNTGNNRVSQVYNFTQMGMADGRTASPNKQWNLLEGFADERGQFTWDNPKANRNQKKQKQELKKVFQKFFGIYDSDPFEDYKDHKNRVCYRSKFHISPDE